MSVRGRFQVVVEEGTVQLGMVPASLPPQRVTLGQVEVGGWADQNGIATGDELVAVNGLKVTELSIVTLDNFLRKMRPLLMTFGSKDGSACEEEPPAPVPAEPPKPVPPAAPTAVQRLRADAGVQAVVPVQGDDSSAFTVVENKGIFFGGEVRQMPATDINRCKDVCSAHDYGAFVVTAGTALFWREPAPYCRERLADCPSSTAYINCSREAAAPLLEVDVGGRWVPFVAEVRRRLAVALAQGETRFEYEHQGGMYEVNLKEMVQISRRTGSRQKVRNSLEEHRQVENTDKPAAQPFVSPTMESDAEEQRLGELVGAWVYRDFEYEVSRMQGGRLLFEQAQRDGRTTVRQVSAILRPRGEWFQGEVLDDERNWRGSLRLRRREGAEETVVSEVKFAEHDEWSEENVARRKPPANPEPLAPLPPPEEPHTPHTPHAAPAQPAAAARPQMSDGVPIWPEHWGITRAQGIELLRRLRRDPKWDSANTVEVMVSDFVVPWTRGSGQGYALQQNPDKQLEVNVVVSHAWQQNAEELLLTIGRSTRRNDVVFVGALSLYQAEDTAGPTVREQMGSDPTQQPYRRILERVAARCQQPRDPFSRCDPCLRLLAWLLAAAAFLLFYSPMLAWGCIPAPDASHCAVQRPLEVGKRAREWTWLPAYDAWVQGNAGSIGVAVLARMPFPAVCTCLGLAMILLAILLHPRSDGRLLAVAGNKRQICSRLSCLHEIVTAEALGVPVVPASSLASAGWCDSQSARCAEQPDEDRIRAEITGKGGMEGFDSINKVVNRLFSRDRWARLFTLVCWAFSVALLRCVDRRLTTAPEGWNGGSDVWDAFYAPFLVIFAVVFAEAFIMFGVAWQAGGAPHVGAMFYFAMCFIIVAASVVMGLILTKDLARTGPDDWAQMLDLLSADCFGYLMPSASGAYGCSAGEAALAALAQTMLTGGLVLLGFIVGGILCPARVPGWLPAVVFAAALAALMVASRWHDEGPLDTEFVFPLIVYHLTALASRSFVPVWAVWAGVNRWGIRLRGFKVMLRRPPAVKDTGGAASTDI